RLPELAGRVAVVVFGGDELFGVGGGSGEGSEREGQVVHQAGGGDVGGVAERGAGVGGLRVGAGMGPEVVELGEIVDTDGVFDGGGGLDDGGFEVPAGGSAILG